MSASVEHPAEPSITPCGCGRAWWLRQRGWLSLHVEGDRAQAARMIGTEAALSAPKLCPEGRMAATPRANP